jgi:uncharacterized cupredoxin-like copper-binding protein
VKTRFVLFFSIAVTAMLVIAACGGDDDDNGGGNGGSYDIEMGEMYFDPDSISAGTGESVELNFENVGTVLHDFTIDDFDGERVHEEFSPGESGSLTLTMPDSAGSYEFYCTVPGHREAGMHGTLTVN